MALQPGSTKLTPPDAIAPLRRAMRLPPAVKSALGEFQRRALAMFPEDIHKIILYGSYARGEATPDSDVDVMVVVKWNDPQQTGGYYLGGPGDARWRRLVNAAVDSMTARAPFVSVLVVGETLFKSGLPVARAAQEEGVILWTSQPT